jgi:hypothetical protein
MSAHEDFEMDSGAGSPSPSEAVKLAADLGRLIDGQVYPSSLAGAAGWGVALARCGSDKRLVLTRRKASQADLPIGSLAIRDGQVGGEPAVAYIAAMNANAARLARELLPFTRPQILGLTRCFGAGDRLGLAGAGHIQAGRLSGKGIGLVLAQQSARELTRTERTHQDVIDAATWAVLQEGYHQPWGADADHLKTFDDVDAAAAAGFTMFTIDPGDHVDDHADRADSTELTLKYNDLPWDALETNGDSMRQAYVDKTFELSGGISLASATPDDLLRAACKYGRAVGHSAAMARRIAETMGDRPFEIEVSVDETASPTRVFEHLFVANELKRLAVPNLVSLAPRFIGEFEKGIDYKGDLDAFEETVRQHVAVARDYGPYKLSIHSGSDKFSVYPIIAQHAGNLVHLKTAGTSYLEALRVIGQVDADLFREIYAFAYERYDDDRASYHVSAKLAQVPKPEDVREDEMAGLLDRVDTRQVFHVTFGAVLTTKGDDGNWLFRDRLLTTLDANEEAHYEALIAHIGRHMRPFASE